MIEVGKPGLLWGGFKGKNEKVIEDKVLLWLELNMPPAVVIKNSLKVSPKNHFYHLPV